MKIAFGDGACFWLFHVFVPKADRALFSSLEKPFFKHLRNDRLPEIEPLYQIEPDVFYNIVLFRRLYPFHADLFSDIMDIRHSGCCGAIL